jgi:hypothetical protein
MKIEAIIAPSSKVLEKLVFFSTKVRISVYPLVALQAMTVI